MAAARSPARSADRSGPVDARVACPQCGGLIHPIAGRCKHCKHDLAATRAARPAAPVALPPLAANRSQPYVTAGSTAAATTPAAGVRAAASSTVAVAQSHAIVERPIAPEDSQPILPPRPTGRQTASGTRSSTWRSWPMIVIVIAIIAIAAAAILLVWPHDDVSAAGARRNQLGPPPAPERMDTLPAPGAPRPRAPGADPWSGPTPAPRAPTIPALPGPGPADPLDPSDPRGPDPFAAPGSSASSMMQRSAGMMSAMVVHACERMATCPHVDVTVTTVCSAAKQGLFTGTPAPTCAAATRCLAKIDRLTCDDLAGPDADLSTSFLLSLATSVQDCMSALQC